MKPRLKEIFDFTGQLHNKLSNQQRKTENYLLGNEWVFIKFNLKVTAQ
jgi:hypothetical protein